MSGPFEVTLGGKSYLLRPFNFSQMRRLAKMMEGLSAADVGFDAFEMALERAAPPIPDPGELEISQPEFEAALAKIMAASGMSKKTAPAMAVEAATALGEAKPLDGAV